jgi:DNA-binding beta-propeller fold protein YncE
LTIDDDDNIYVADNGNSGIRKITPTGVVTTLVVDEDLLVTPTGLAINCYGTIYAPEYEMYRIRKNYL